MLEGGVRMRRHRHSGCGWEIGYMEQMSEPTEQTGTYAEESESQAGEGRYTGESYEDSRRQIGIGGISTHLWFLPI